MALRFDHMLTEVGLELSEVRLLRHQDTRHGRKRTPFALWREDPALFERYQSTQKRAHRASFSGTHWASFVGTPDGGTLFVGLFEVGSPSDIPSDWIDPITDQIPGAGQTHEPEYDLYPCRLSPLLQNYVGRVWIDWKLNTSRNWRHRADARNKPIIEIGRAFQDPAYPGHSKLITDLSRFESLPETWRAILREAKGIYLLVCPRTKEQYVGMACGADGFLGRWREYVTTGHGGNVRLKSRTPSDYQVSILQVAGSDATVRDIEQMEILWKRKLLSREMGLNAN